MGKMMGCSLHSPMAVNTSGVNKGPAPERPISMLGFTCMHRQTVSSQALTATTKQPFKRFTVMQACIRVPGCHSVGLTVRHTDETLLTAELLLSHCAVVAVLGW